jgi:hypothetical protein
MCVVIVAAIIALTTQTSAKEKTVLQGFGSATCGRFADLYRRDPKNAEQWFYFWAQGFMSGLNVGAKNQDLARDLSSMSIEDQMKQLRAYCDMHPLAEYFEAVAYLFGELKQ